MKAGLLIVALFMAACAGRALGLDEGEELGASLVADLAVVGERDLAVPLDAGSVGDGPKRHLGAPCDRDDECLSGDCLTPSETRGQFGNLCGAACGAGRACVEGVCLTFDFDVYWCLPTCDIQEHSQDCPSNFLCCQGAGVDACVAPSALTCRPL
jgi:hypothetical protein